MITTTTITAFNGSTSYDLTSRTYSATCSTSCKPGQFGRGRAAFDFLNNDGAMTPGAGGTYSSVNWFGTAIRITCVTTVAGTQTAFAGIITDFQLTDDGVNSYVRITAVDGFSIGGTAITTVATGTTIVAGTTDYWINSFYNGNSSYINNAGMPKLGATASDVYATNVGQSAIGMGTKNWSASGRASDFVNNSIMPAGPNFAWPTRIESSASNTRYFYNVADLYPIRSNPTLTFTFAENPGTGELPILNLVRGFDSDDLLNVASISTLPIVADGSTYSTTQTNTASQALYGTRAITMTSMMAGAITGTNSQESGQNRAAQTVAQRWANTYSDSDFVALSLEVTDSSLTGNGTTGTTSVTAWNYLLDVTTALLQLTRVYYQPTGAASETTDTLITVGRTIVFTPSDVRIKVDFMVADRSAFILDNTYLGVLDQNRLG